MNSSSRRTHPPDAEPLNAPTARRASLSGIPQFVRRQPRTASVAPVALYAAVALGLCLVSLEPRFGTPWWIPALLGIGGTACLIARVRHQLATFICALVLALLSLAFGTGAETLLPVITLYGLGVRRPAPVAWMCTFVTMAFGAVGAQVLVLRLASGPSLWGSPPLTPRNATFDWLLAYGAIAAVLLVTALLGTSVGQRRRYVASLLERAEQLARERDQQAEIASARERERITREMHDVIAHSLSVMIAMSDGAQAAVQDRPEESRRAIGRVAETGRRTLTEVRRLLGSVREAPPASRPLPPQPGAGQLGALIEEFVAAGVSARLVERGEPTADPAVGLTVYRIVQESLTNALRHGRELEQVTAEVTWSREEVVIDVRDRSQPALPNADGVGRGIIGMRERVTMFDGTLETGPQPGGGWRVLARLPLGEWTS